ncbi:MAG: DNA recombination protein RmuC [Bacteroidaceae bacterium]|nr:DNA recombination protein RmuC [Bacteroidaceae bacterium]
MLLTEIIPFLLGLILGGLILWLIGRNKIMEARGHSQAAQATIDDLQAFRQEEKDETNALRQQKEVLDRQVASLQRELELNDRQNAELQQKWMQQLDLVKERLDNATRDLLKSRAQELETQNRQQLEPFRQQLDALRLHIAQSRENSIKDTAEMKHHIDLMLQATRSMNDEASRLADALTSKPKFQGNMGESILSNVLESNGLRQGREYDLQTTLRTSTGTTLQNDQSGSRMQPDAILHYPDKRDIVVDSKVSLTDYVNYVNAEDEHQKNIYLNAHLSSVRRHIDELARKNYAQYIPSPRKAFDYMVMFLPFEGAFQAAIYADPTIWQYAFNKKILLAGELNIALLLTMIKTAWIHYDQSKNQLETYRIAQNLVDRCTTLKKKMEILQKSYEAMGGKMEDVNTSLSGKLGVLPTAVRLVDLGVKSEKLIDEESLKPDSSENL